MNVVYNCIAVEKTGIFHSVLGDGDTIDYFRVIENKPSQKIQLYDIGRLRTRVWDDTLQDFKDIWYQGGGFKITGCVGYCKSCWWKNKIVANDSFGAIPGGRIIKTNGFGNSRNVSLAECKLPTHPLFKF